MALSRLDARREILLTRTETKNEKDRHFLLAIWSVGSYDHDRDALPMSED
jgi:hypothetical protein